MRKHLLLVDIRRGRRPALDAWLWVEWPFAPMTKQELEAFLVMAKGADYGPEVLKADSVMRAMKARMMFNQHLKLVILDDEEGSLCVRAEVEEWLASRTPTQFNRLIEEK